MSPSGLCQLQLTCTDKAEASLIADHLLDKKLIACARQTGVSSEFLWEGAKSQSNEVLLLMETKVKFFNEIEKVIQQLHSYETFVLTAFPMVGVSKKAEAWLNESLKDE